MELAPLLLTALVLGSLHALEADHLAAVTSFAVRAPRPGEAARFGLRWAAGHGGSVIVAGTALLALQWNLPDSAGAWFERLVGLSLVALGIWTIRGSATLHTHLHRHRDGTVHSHLHGHHFGPDHDHGHAATAIGALHGLAGAAPAAALLPLAASERLWLAPLALGLFAAGTAAAMALYAMLAGWAAERALLRSDALARWLAAMTGAVTVAIGVFWLVR